MEGRQEIDGEGRRDMACHCSNGFRRRGVRELYYSVRWRLSVGSRRRQGHVGNEWLGNAVEGDEVAGEGGGGTTWDNCSIGEENEGAASEEVRAHAHAEFCFKFCIGSGVVGTS